MKNLIIYSALLLCLFVTKFFAQETFESKAKIIANKIEIITQTEKNALKQEIESVNLQLEKGQITKVQADEKKLQLAQARATIIENKVAEMQMELKDLIQQKVDGKIGYKTEVGDVTSKKNILKLEDGKAINIQDVVKFVESSGNKKVYSTVTDSTFISISIKRNKKYGTSRNTFELNAAFGFTNVVTNASIANSPYRYLGSHFYEFGFLISHELIKKSKFLNLRFGLSFTYNNLRPTDDNFFVVNNNQTTLQNSNRSLHDSRLRNVLMTFPVFLELDFSKPKQIDGKTILRKYKGFKMGLGGYLGTNLGTRQHVEYESNGYNNEDIRRGDFNTSNFIYGLSAYLGHKRTSLYLKYDLNPLFKNNPVKENSISLGLRFDM